MKGYAQNLEVDHEHITCEAIGLVFARDFPDLDIVREVIEKGITNEPEAVWVFKSKPDYRSTAALLAVEILESHGIEPFYAVSNSKFWGSAASQWRDGELATCTKLVIVFHEPNNITTLGWTKKFNTNIHIIERGKKKKAKRKGRTPQGE